MKKKNVFKYHSKWQDIFHIYAECEKQLDFKSKHGHESISYCSDLKLGVAWQARQDSRSICGKLWSCFDFCIIQHLVSADTVRIDQLFLQTEKKRQRSIYA